MSKKHKGLKKPAIHSDRLYYWAYGSNLNVRQMHRRCPMAKRSAPMVVNDCALVFRSVADVTIRKDQQTPGGLWAITNACERALDAYEGVSQRLYMKRYFIIKTDGVQRTCLFYQMRTSKGIMPPTRSYLATIQQGYEDFDLDPAILKAALDESWADKAMTQHLHERAERNGWPRLARALEKKDDRMTLIEERMRAMPQRAPAKDDAYGDEEALEQQEADESHGGLTE